MYRIRMVNMKTTECPDKEPAHLIDALKRINLTEYLAQRILMYEPVAGHYCIKKDYHVVIVPTEKGYQLTKYQEVRD